MEQGLRRQRLSERGGYLKQYWRRISLYAVAALAVIIIIIQFVYPWNKLPLYSTIDGAHLGGQSVNDATNNLNEKYRQLSVNLYFGTSPKPYRTPTTGDIGVSVNADKQVQSATYSWWLRLIPTSLWWAHAVIKPSSPSYDHNTNKSNAYIDAQFGKSCNVDPANTSIEYTNNKLQVVPAIDGGTCKLPDVQQQLASTSPRLASHSIHIAIDARPAKLHDNVAVNMISQLNAKTNGGVQIQTGDTSVLASQNDLLSWLDFASSDTAITVLVNAQRSADFFSKQLAPKVTINPGTSHVTTLDFAEISRSDAPSGQGLDSTATIAVLNDWINGKIDKPVAKVASVPPIVAYTRTYTATDTGMTALITQFAQAHPGQQFGVSFAELDGQHRHAGYNDTTIFETASTYKLFVAYSTLKRIESGTFHWSDQIQGGRDLTKCFDDMIVKSDNDCAEALLNKIGFKSITAEIQAIGLTHSSFLNSYIQTTPGDLTTFTGALYSGQLLSPSSTSTLISAMKRNQYRQGIPAGETGQVADKVGFLNALLHDAAIVYSPTGTYSLTIMTNNSSWATIADLARQIEALRTQS